VTVSPLVVTGPAVVKPVKPVMVKPVKPVMVKPVMVRLVW
jgi:hypothetical protein